MSFKNRRTLPPFKKAILSFQKSRTDGTRSTNSSDDLALKNSIQSQIRFVVKCDFINVKSIEMKNNANFESEELAKKTFR